MIKIKRIIINWLKLKYLRKKYPESTINSKFISKDIVLEEKCLINPEVKIFNNVKMGKYSYINGGTIIGSNTYIGRFTSISYNCVIALNEHPINHLSTSPHLYGEKNIFKVDSKYDESFGETKIGHDVWIGSNVTILRGITIGDGSIIAAGAVVTKNVRPYTIVGGVPAKLIKHRYPTGIENRVKKLNWWNMTEEELFNYKDMFLNKISE